MIRRKKFNLTTVSLTAIISAGTMGFLWNLRSETPFLNYAEVHSILNNESPNHCRIQSVIVSTGEPIIAVHLSDKSVRNLFVSSDQKCEFLTNLFHKGIPISLLAAH